MDYAFKKFGDKKESQFKGKEEMEGRFIQYRGKKIFLSNWKFQLGKD